MDTDVWVTASSFGPALGIVFIFIAVGLIGTALWVWALVDCATRPGSAFRQALAGRVLWLVLMEWLGAVIYLLAILPRLSPARAYPASWYTPQPSGAGDGIGHVRWYRDPTDRHEMRHWDGAEWTSFVADGGLTSFDPLPP